MQDHHDHQADTGKKLHGISADAIAAMAGAIVEAARQRGCVSESDFQRAGVPARLIEPNREAALAVARQLEPRLDAMLSAGAAT